MRNIQNKASFGQLLIIFILIALLGLSPRPHRAVTEMQKAWRAVRTASPHLAAGDLAAAADLLPRRYDLRELAGHYALEAGDFEAAVRYLERVDQGATPVGGELSLQGLADLGDAYQKVGDLEAATHAWQAALARGGPSNELSQRLLQAHRALGDYPAVIEDLRTLVSQKPSDASLHYQLGLLLATQQPEAALAHMVQAAELDPSLANSVETLRRSLNTARIAEDPAYILLASGRALASLGEWELAAEAFRQTVLSRPDYAEAWAYLGEARQHLSADRQAIDPKQSLSDLEKAVELDPKSLAAHTFLAMYWGRQERYDLELNSLKKAAELDPTNPVLQVELGSTLATLGDLQVALEAYQQAVAMAPRDPAYLNFLAGFSLKYEFQISQIALPAARRAVQMAPKDPAILDLMGQVLIKLNDLTSAERFLSRSLQADPNYAPAHLHLGSLYLLSGDSALARQELELARSLAPGSPAADQSHRLLKTYYP